MVHMAPPVLTRSRTITLLHCQSPRPPWRLAFEATCNRPVSFHSTCPVQRHGLSDFARRHQEEADHNGHSFGLADFADPSNFISADW
jgi:hypothetical protein